MTDQLKGMGPSVGYNVYNMLLIIPYILMLARYLIKKNLFKRWEWSN